MRSIPWIFSSYSVVFVPRLYFLLSRMNEDYFNVESFTQRFSCKLFYLNTEINRIFVDYKLTGILISFSIEISGKKCYFEYLARSIFVVGVIALAPKKQTRAFLAFHNRKPFQCCKLANV